MSELDLVIRGHAVVDRARTVVTVGIAGSRIAAVQPGRLPLTARRVVELAEDEVLIPGLVDTHVHVNEPGRTEWEGFETATKAAAAGGVTTIVDMPLNSIPPTIDLPGLGVKRASANGQCHVDVGFWGGAVPSSLGHLRELHDAGVFGFKCFLLHSGVDEFPPLTMDELDAALAEVAGFDGLMIVHAEDARTIDSAPDCRGPSYAAFLSSRPPAAEDVAIAGVIERAARHDARVHILHLSSATSLETIAKARADGVRVSVETCPHYLTLSAEEIEEGQTQFKCCPPIRDTTNQHRLWQGLEDGVIDCVVSDHSPSTPDLKHLDTGDFGEAWGGVSSLQLGLPVVWTAARRRGHDLVDVVGWMAERTSEVAGIAHKGRIGVGYDADLAVFAPEEGFVVDPATLHHRNPVTPYAGAELLGVVRRVWLRGTSVVGPDSTPDGHPNGRFLSRGEQTFVAD